MSSSVYAKAITSFSHQPHNSDDSGSDRSPLTTDAAVGRPELQQQSLALVSAKKPRGRPQGSRNKPKPPVVITRDCDSSMKPVVLEISAGSDVIETITSFARRRRVGITLLSGSGSVSNVTLRHPVSHAPSSLVSLHGPFHLLSLWGSFMGFKTTANAGECGGFSITLAGVQGQVFGGVVGGKVVAAGPVVVVVATYLNPLFESLSSAARGGEEGGEQQTEAKASGPITAADVMPWNGGCASK